MKPSDGSPGAFFEPSPPRGHGQLGRLQARKAGPATGSQRGLSPRISPQGTRVLRKKAQCDRARTEGWTPTGVLTTREVQDVFSLQKRIGFCRSSAIRSRQASKSLTDWKQDRHHSLGQSTDVL